MIFLEKLFFNLFCLACSFFISNIALAQFGNNPHSQSVDNIRVGKTANPSSVLPPIINLLLEDPLTPAVFTVSNPSGIEGEQIDFEIEFNETLETNIGISCAPKNGTAELFHDYEWPFDFDTFEPEQTVLSFQKGQKLKTVSILTYARDTDFGTKTFQLICKQIGTSESSTGIANIFYKPNIRLVSPFSNTINEGESFNFEVSIEGDPVTIDTTIKYSIRSDTAINGEDYLDETNGAVTFMPGETSKTISIKSVDDNSLQRARELEITLDEAVTNSEGVDVVLYDFKRLLILDNEPNYSSDVDISNITPAIGAITEKGPHLWIESTGGEEIGQGFNYFYSQVNSNIQVNSYDNSKIDIRVNGASQPIIDNESWYIEFESGDSDEIIVGSYIQAFSDSRFNSNENKLLVDGPNFSSCTSTGSFRIFELEKTDTLINKLSADFEMYCNGSNKPLRGAIKYDVSLPDAIFPPLQLPTGEPYPTLPSLSSSGTAIEIEGAAGDWVTLGASNSFNNSNAIFRYTPISNNTGISIDIIPTGGSPSSWSIDLQRHPLDIYNLNNGRLAVGVYENVTQSQFNNLKPRLEFGNSERRCSSSSGLFRIFEISYDIFGVLEHLTADFEQSCNGGPISKVSIKYIK